MMEIMSFQRKIKIDAADQAGFASIVIALTLIIVLALLTVGFAQLARREQQTALNKQLANQAYYAAESGVNDAIQDIHAGVICDPSIPHTLDAPCAPTSVPPSSTKCMTSLGAGNGTQTLPLTAATAKPKINASAGVAYTCLLVDQSPSSVDFTDITPADGQYLEFSTQNPLSSLTINWWSFDNHKAFQTSSPSSGEFMSQSAWGNAPPMLLFSLTKIDNPNHIKRSVLLSNTFNLNLYPANVSSGFSTNGAPDNSTIVNWDVSKQGEVVPGNCGNNTDPGKASQCSVTISGLSSNYYVMHILPYYDGANVHITGLDSSNSKEQFIGQDEIDVTGKAHNVLKRIRVRVNADGVNGSVLNPAIQPGVALQAQNICKRLSVLPNSEGGTSFVDPGGGAPSTACNLNL
jgi:Tfp pilus assembly protein PilX